eukprot:2245697-Heterocapsa_arctica.AAC.1
MESWGPRSQRGRDRLDTPDPCAEGRSLFEPRHGVKRITCDVARRLSGPTPIRRWLLRISRRVGLVLGWA